MAVDELTRAEADERWVANATPQNVEDTLRYWSGELAEGWSFESLDRLTQVVDMVARWVERREGGSAAE